MPGLGRPEGSWLLGATPQPALCFSGIATSIGSTIHSQLRSTVYETLASLRGLGQGEWDQHPGWCIGGTPHFSFSSGFLLLP